MSLYTGSRVATVIFVIIIGKEGQKMKQSSGMESIH